jgi:hypothetical protein
MTALPEAGERNAIRAMAELLRVYLTEKGFQSPMFIGVCADRATSSPLGLGYQSESDNGVVMIERESESDAHALH